MTMLTTVLIRTVVSLAVIAVTVDGLHRPASSPPSTSIEAFEGALAGMPCLTLVPAFRKGVFVGWRVLGDGLPQDVVQRGDVITGVNGLSPTPASFTAGLHRDVLNLTIERGGLLFEVVLHAES